MQTLKARSFEIKAHNSKQNVCNDFYFRAGELSLTLKSYSS